MYGRKLILHDCAMLYFGFCKNLGTLVCVVCRVLVSNFTEDQLDRYEMFRRAAFPKAAVKRVRQQQVSLIQCLCNVSGQSTLLYSELYRSTRRCNYLAEAYYATFCLLLSVICIVTFIDMVVLFGVVADAVNIRHDYSTECRHSHGWYRQGVCRRGCRRM